MSNAIADASLPRILCDFNAQGWSGQPEDNCYYAFDQKALDRLTPAEGMRLFIYDDNGDGEVIGCVGQLESYNGSWRIRPSESTWFEGPLPERAD